MAIVDTGGQSAGNGGDGFSQGALTNHDRASFSPMNEAFAGAEHSSGGSSADARQMNIAEFDQGGHQAAGIGGDGGNDNLARGGDVGLALAHVGLAGSNVIYTGGNDAGDGGAGTFAGSLVDSGLATYHPANVAGSGGHAMADAHQANAAYVDQGTAQFAGAGGDGGGDNAAWGGDVGVTLMHSGPAGAIGISTGGNDAGDGGDGTFFGSLVDSDVAVYRPLNFAMAGDHGAATAHQANMVYFDQAALQIAGVGGDGGHGNLVLGGDVDAMLATYGLLGSNAIATGGNSAGNGGDGTFAGSLVDINVAVYAPINIAIAGANGTANAQQTNIVDFNQGATQIAGVGGDGGHNNLALGGDAGLSSAGHGSAVFDVIATGGNSAGNGGDGHAAGKLVDVDVAEYAPINIAVAGADGTATAQQTNVVHFDQGATQIAGVGGDGGHGNLALGGDLGLFFYDHPFT